MVHLWRRRDKRQRSPTAPADPPAPGTPADPCGSPYYIRPVSPPRVAARGASVRCIVGPTLAVGLVVVGLVAVGLVVVGLVAVGLVAVGLPHWQSQCGRTGIISARYTGNALSCPALQAFCPSPQSGRDRFRL